MNVLSAIGNVGGKDAELRFTDKGDPVAQFSFALTSGYGDKAVTTWLNCNLWGKRAETLTPMLLKGTKIGITGELTNRKYAAKDGTEKYSLELRVNDLTLLGKKNGQASENNAPKSDAGNDKVDSFDNLEEPLPF